MDLFFYGLVGLALLNLYVLVRGYKSYFSHVLPYLFLGGYFYSPESLWGTISWVLATLFASGSIVWVIYGPKHPKLRSQQVESMVRFEGG